MRAFYTNEHASHDPESFIARGQVCPCPEQARRADILLAAARDANHETIACTGPMAAEALVGIHDADYLNFLATAWEHWSALPDFGAEIVPNVHPSRNMANGRKNGRPNAIVALAGHYQADTACPIGPGTWDGIRASATVAVTAADAVMADRAAGQPMPHAYALCRPPGHHAYGDQAGGFCFLNNTAIAAQRCRTLGADRVAILDVDVHHGNGTQGIFYKRADVLTVSLHGDPSEYYPYFAGYADEAGAEGGLGFNLNLPLAQGTGDSEYLKAFAAAETRIRGFSPDVLIVALGLDASVSDPPAYFGLTTEGFGKLGQALGGFGLPTVLVQEGGYISPVLGDNLVAALAGFEATRS